ncbi:FixH family protein [Alkalihalobacillus sp. CinArs1]|uniref:FixH family protein n=1 Tax=Alkalihalobacillus sp. CinArs1 TaxID=2995314 RepID=UPI0022DD9029|nr:FixH family protein [Alkalihalobacillus sp. CinArs1]
MRMLAILGLSLMLVACGTGEEGATENSGESNSPEMKEENDGATDDNKMKESEEKGSDREEGMADSLSVEIIKKENNQEGHHDSGLMIMLEQGSENPATLTALVQKEDDAVEGASVRFEYWKEGEEKHIYTDAEEIESGEYQAETEIMDEGTYNMKVHVEKGDNLHTHKPYTLEVKTAQSS